MKIVQKLKGSVDKVIGVEKKYRIISYSTLAFLAYTSNNLKLQVLELSTKNVILNSELNNLKRNVVFYYRSFENSPVEMWQKKKVGNRFIMQYVNPAYLKQWGHIFKYDRFNLIGKDNFQLGYPEKIAKQYYNNDLMVAITGIPLRKIEQAPDSTGKMLYFKIIKYREIREKDTLINGKILDYLDE